MRTSIGNVPTISKYTTIGIWLVYSLDSITITCCSKGPSAQPTTEPWVDLQPIKTLDVVPLTDQGDIEL